MGELAIFVAIDAVIKIATSIGVCPTIIVGQRHAATLAEFLFHVIIFCSIVQWSDL